MNDADLKQLVKSLAQQAGLAIDEGELVHVAAQYEELLQQLDTVESVQVEIEEESAVALDLFAWETVPEGPVAAREGDAP